MERECRLSFTESIENYSKNAVKPRTTEGELIFMYIVIHVHYTCSLYMYMYNALGGEGEEGLHVILVP